MRPSHLHAVLSQAFDATADQHRAKAKPYAIGQVKIVRDTLSAEVSVLADAAAGRFAQWIGEFAESGGRLGANPVTFDPQSGVQLVSVATFEELLLNARPRHRWRFEFLTPTTFRQGSYATQPLPVSNSVFGGLRARWNTFTDIGQLDVDLDPLALNPDAFEIATVPGVEVRKKPVRAFTGWVSYSCHRPPEKEATILDALASFAEYSGVGAYTPFGMGCVRIRR